MKLFKKVLLKQSIVPIVEIVSKGISFINTLLLIRIISIYEYADYSYTLAIILWTAILMDGGINGYIYNKSLKKEKKGINRLYTARFFLSSLVILVIWFFFYFFQQRIFITALLLSLGIYFTSTSTLIKMLSRGFGFVKVDIISIISEPTLKFVLLLVLYFTKNAFNYDLNTVLLLYLISGITAFIFNKFYLHAHYNLKILYRKVSVIFFVIYESLKLSKYYLLTFLMFIGMARMDVVFLEIYSTKTDLAFFSSAFSIYQAVQLFFFSLITSQFSFFNKNKLKAFQTITALATLILILIFTLSTLIFRLFFPFEYLEGSNILKHLIFALIPSIFNYFIITKNNFDSKTKYTFYILSVMFFIKLIMYLVSKSSDTIFYCYSIVITETATMLIFLISKYKNRKTQFLSNN